MPDLFTRGNLEMSATPVPHEAEALMWGDCLVNRIAVLVVMALFIVELAELFRLFPPLLRCLSRWKGNLDLEHSVSMARTRNNVALVTALVMCIIADRWVLTDSSVKASLPAEWRLAFTAALIGGYVVLRQLMYLISRFRSRTNEYALCLRHSMYNYQIMLSTLMLLSVIPLLAFRAPDEIVRIVLLVETAAFTLLYLLRSFQILASRCSNYATILYLCALEILPLGILAFVCTL